MSDKPSLPCSCEDDTCPAETYAQVTGSRSCTYTEDFPDQIVVHTYTRSVDKALVSV